MAERFVHSADWQIGKVFADLVGEDPDQAALLKRERISAVERIAALARERQADCVIAAGDVFDSHTVPDDVLRRTVLAMAGYSGPWLLLPGNHDAALFESVWTRLVRLGLPANVKPLLSAEPVILKDGKLAVLPAPLLRRHESIDVSDALDTMVSPVGAVRVGVAHGSVKNRLPERSEATNEIADDRVQRARLDYLALGDWHGFLPIADRTYYAGTPEPDRFKDADRSPSGQVLFVEMEGPGCPPLVDVVKTGHFQWEKRKLTVLSEADVALVEAMLMGLAQPHRQTLLDLTLMGSLPLSAEQSLRKLLSEWRARLHLLRVHDDALLPEVSEDELDNLPAEGLLRNVVAELRQKQQQPSEAGERAKLALKLLVEEYRQAVGT